MNQKEYHLKNQDKSKEYHQRNKGEKHK